MYYHNAKINKLINITKKKTIMAKTSGGTKGVASKKVRVLEVATKKNTSNENASIIKKINPLVDKMIKNREERAKKVADYNKLKAKIDRVPILEQTKEMTQKENKARKKLNDDKVKIDKEYEKIREKINQISAPIYAKGEDTFDLIDKKRRNKLLKVQKNNI